MPGVPSGYRLPAPLAAIAEASEYILNITVANRMRQLGIPEEMIGYTLNRQRLRAFTRETTSGGTNMPSRYGHPPGISVDEGILDPRFPALQGKARLESWETASLKDRLDAVIVHEFAEALALAAPTDWYESAWGTWDQHRQAVRVAPELARQWRLSQRTQAILLETRLLEGLAD